MPCDTIQTTSVDFKGTDAKLLMLALGVLGLNPRQQGNEIHFQNGVYSITDKNMDLRGSSVETRISEIKKAYSTEVVKTQAKKFGWQMKEIEPNKYQVVKRSF